MDVTLSNRKINMNTNVTEFLLCSMSSATVLWGIC